MKSNHIFKYILFIIVLSTIAIFFSLLLKRPIIISGSNNDEQNQVNKNAEKEYSEISNMVEANMKSYWSLSKNIEEEVAEKVNSIDNAYFNEIELIGNNAIYEKIFEPYYYYGEPYSIKYTFIMPKNFSSNLVVNSHSERNLLSDVHHYMKNILPSKGVEFARIEVLNSKDKENITSDHLVINIPNYLEVKKLDESSSDYKLISTSNFIFHTYHSIQTSVGPNGDARLELKESHSVFYDNISNSTIFESVNLFFIENYPRQSLFNEVIISEDLSIRFDTPTILDVREFDR